MTATASVVAAAVFLVALVALTVDRSRLQRRLARVERSEALLETDLADARRELAAVRECLRSGDAQSEARGGRPGTGGPTAPVS